MADEKVNVVLLKDDLIYLHGHLALEVDRYEQAGNPVMPVVLRRAIAALYDASVNPQAVIQRPVKMTLELDE